MARRRVGDAAVENGKNKEEEIDTHRTVFIDTNLDTHLALVISESDSVLDLKKKVMLEHLQCFPKLGEIIIHALKVKRKGHFYHLSDSMHVNRAFEGVKNSWFLSVDASYLKQVSDNEQSRRPNMSNQSPILCLPYNLTNTEFHNDDASTSVVLKSAASVERLTNQNFQPIPVDSCREFSEDVVTNHMCSSAEILKIGCADLNRAPDLPTAGIIASNIQCSNSVEPSSETGLPVKRKKQKIKDNVDELGDWLAKEIIAFNHVSGGEASCPETLLSANMLVGAEKAESKGNTQLENRDQMTMSSRIEKMKSKKKRKRDEMNLSSADNQERASFPLSVKDSAIEDGVKKKNIPSNHVTGEVLSPPEILAPLNLLQNTERKEHKEIGDPLKQNKVPVSTSKEDIELPKNFEEQNNSPKIMLDTLSSEPADNSHLRTRPGNKNKRGEKKGKKDVKRKKDVTFNLPSEAVLPSSVQDAGGDESLQEKNISLNHVSDEDESHHEVAVPVNLVASEERTEHEGTSGDASKENKVLVSTNETSTQEIEMTEKSMENRRDSQKIVVDTLPSPAAKSENLKMGTSIKSKKNKKKRKTDAIIDISESAKDTGAAESLNDKKSVSNNVSSKDETHPESAVPANLLVDGEKTDCEKIRDSSEHDKKSIPSKTTSTRGIGLNGNTVDDRRIVVSGTLSPEPAENEHSVINSTIKHNKSKKKSKKDTKFSLSSANVLPSSAQDVAEDESYKEKNIALTNGSGKDESHLQIVQSAKMIKDKSGKDQANFNTPCQPAVSESGSDRIDFKHYFLPRKAEDKVAGSDKTGITRSERDDKIKKKTKKSTPSLLTSHDQALELHSSKNQEGGVNSHIKCSSDIDPQESFSKNASSGSLHPSKKSTSNVHKKELPSSLEPDHARTPHSVLRASGIVVSGNRTPAPAHRKGQKVSSGDSSSSSESFGKSHQGTKSKNRVSIGDRYLVACEKGSAEGTCEVKSRPLHKKSLLATKGTIFKDDSSDSSDDEEASEQFNAHTPSEDLSSDSDRESDMSLESLTKGSSGLDKKEDVENIEKKRSSNLTNTTINMILRSSSRYKKAKLTAESQPEVEDSESQPVDCVPDSQANP